MQHLDEAKERRITQLRKGILELAILRALSHQKHYGYSLVRLLSDTGASFQEGTIYPILARLDREGLVTSEWVESDQGPPRKYYSVTPAGRRVLDELSDEFDRLAALVRRARPALSSVEIGKKILVSKR